MKRFLSCLAALMMSLSLSFFSAARLIPPVSAVSLTEDQTGAISVGCASIKSSLRSLQKSDASTRAHLGTTYQTILSSYLTPLNLRLVRNGSLSSSLNTLLSDYTEKRSRFNEDYITYSRSLEELLNIDCQSNPAAFYEKLTETRTRRQSVATNVSDLKNILDKHLSAVQELKHVK